MRWLSEHIGQHKVAFRCNNVDALATAVADGLGLGHPAAPGRQAASGAALPVRRRGRPQPRDMAGPTRELRDVPRIRVACDWLVERFHRDEACFA